MKFHILNMKVMALICVLFSLNALAGEKNKDSVGLMPAKVYSDDYQLNESKAYNLQHALIENAHIKKVGVIGYKAGLMNVNAFEKFALTSPVTGVLLESSLLTADSVGNYSYSLAAALNLMIEQEFAFQLSQSITHSITADDVIKYVNNVSLSIELPDVSFQTKSFRGVDIIANNVLANKIVLSDWLPLNSDVFEQLDTQTLQLICEGKVVATGKGNNTLMGQKEALVWMINHLVKEGFTLKKGMVLLTGNLITMTKAKPCHYTARFSELGEITLTVTP